MLIFFGIVASVDVGAGIVFGNILLPRAKGRTGVEYHVCKLFSEDILVMGSSRASHHYVPRTIMDSLGMSCFNGGQDGNGIIMQYGRWKMLSKRHFPKLVIYDIEPAFDMSENDNERYIDRLKPYASDKGVKRYIATIFPIEKFKLVSQMYRYNYKFLEILSDCFVSSEIQGGYIPLQGHIRQEAMDAQPEMEVVTPVLDSVKLEYLERLIVEVQENDSRIVLVSSPYWKGHSRFDFSTIEALSDKYGVVFMNYGDSSMSENPDYFADSMHLNDEGAKAFTEDLVLKLKSVI